MRDEQRRVGQKLAYAGWALREAEAGGPQLPAVRAGLVEATVLHLAGAYRAFLAEIVAGEHVWRHREEVTIGDSAVAIARAWPDYLPPALAELVALEESGEWPVELLAAQQWAGRTGEGLAPSAAGGVDVIALVPVCTGPQAPSWEDCRRWHDTLQTLVERLRDGMQEW